MGQTDSKVTENIDESAKLPSETDESPVEQTSDFPEKTEAEEEEKPEEINEKEENPVETEEAEEEKPIEAEEKSDAVVEKEEPETVVEEEEPEKAAVEEKPSEVEDGENQEEPNDAEEKPEKIKSSETKEQIDDILEKTDQMIEEKENPPVSETDKPSEAEDEVVEEPKEEKPAPIYEFVDEVYAEGVELENEIKKLTEKEKLTLLWKNAQNHISSNFGVEVSFPFDPNQIAKFKNSEIDDQKLMEITLQYLCCQDKFQKGIKGFSKRANIIAAPDEDGEEHSKEKSLVIRRTRSTKRTVSVLESESFDFDELLFHSTKKRLIRQRFDAAKTKAYEPFRTIVTESNEGELIRKRFGEIHGEMTKNLSEVETQIQNDILKAVKQLKENLNRHCKRQDDIINAKDGIAKMQEFYSSMQEERRKAEQKKAEEKRKQEEIKMRKAEQKRLEQMRKLQEQQAKARAAEQARIQAQMRAQYEQMEKQRKAQAAEAARRQKEMAEKQRQILEQQQKMAAQQEAQRLQMQQQQQKLAAEQEAQMQQQATLQQQQQLAAQQEAERVQMQQQQAQLAQQQEQERKDMAAKQQALVTEQATQAKAEDEKDKKMSARQARLRKKQEEFMRMAMEMKREEEEAKKKREQAQKEEEERIQREREEREAKKNEGGMKARSEAEMRARREAEAFAQRQAELQRRKEAQEAKEKADAEAKKVAAPTFLSSTVPSFLSSNSNTPVSFGSSSGLSAPSFLGSANKAPISFSKKPAPVSFGNAPKAPSFLSNANKPMVSSFGNAASKPRVSSFGSSTGSSLAAPSFLAKSTPTQSSSLATPSFLSKSTPAQAPSFLAKSTPAQAPSFLAKSTPAQAPSFLAKSTPAKPMFGATAGTPHQEPITPAKAEEPMEVEPKKPAAPLDRKEYGGGKRWKQRKAFVEEAREKANDYLKRNKISALKLRGRIGRVINQISATQDQIEKTVGSIQDILAAADENKMPYICLTISDRFVTSCAKKICVNLKLAYSYGFILYGISIDNEYLAKLILYVLSEKCPFVVPYIPLLKDFDSPVAYLEVMRRGRQDEPDEPGIIVGGIRWETEEHYYETVKGMMGLYAGFIDVNKADHPRPDEGKKYLERMTRIIQKYKKLPASVVNTVLPVLEVAGFSLHRRYPEEHKALLKAITDNKKKFPVNTPIRKQKHRELELVVEEQRSGVREPAGRHIYADLQVRQEDIVWNIEDERNKQNQARESRREERREERRERGGDDRYRGDRDRRSDRRRYD